MTDYNVGVLILYNQGSGVFDQQIVDLNPASFTYIFDIDNDGDNDLGLYEHEYFPGGICTLKIYENQSDNFILKKTIYFPTGTLFRKFADLTMTVFFDIAYIRSIWGEPIDSRYVIFNKQDMTFSSPDRYFINVQGLLEMDADDFDANGYIDLAYTYYGSEDSITVLFNDGTGKFVENPLTSIENYDNQPVNISFYPNPFSTTIQICFSNRFQNLSDVNIGIYDLRGRIVKNIMAPDLMKNGDNLQFTWDGKENQGYRCKPGIYLLKCYYGNTFSSSKLVLID